MSKGEKFVASEGGATSSRVMRLDLIPYSTFVRLAGRYEYGLERHGEDNWKKGLGDRAYAIDRAIHVSIHALRLAKKLRGELEEDGDDDVGAILWGGSFLAEALEALSAQRKNCSACGEGLGWITDKDGDRIECPACKGTGKQKS